ncbi:hypothetical protein NARC_160058 [Candidatus Nitrosocosmicus arcticus]|uniref:Uncharacterized protein n=1 Tax=Candidatus Nitrosocosmicus arcticus TaxID=2035267 RepID=A0A557SRX9_9ARCH|nr:hypothetical protein NARC_160058 [Candidatus Nitrosocosmicus arcticus]
MVIIYTPNRFIQLIEEYRITHRSLTLFTEPLYHTGLNPTEPATYFGNDIGRYKM